MGRYMKRFFDYAVADEMHELANDTAQGQALGPMASMARRTLALTGTYSTCARRSNRTPPRRS
jgi:hypothetical protein